jgi:hypothetical protein
VDQRAAQYRLRLARPDEMSRIREIEDKAGTVFAGLDLMRKDSTPHSQPRTWLGSLVSDKSWSQLTQPTSRSA